MMHDEVDRFEGVPWKKKKITLASWNVAAFSGSAVDKIKRLDSFWQDSR